MSDYSSRFDGLARLYGVDRLASFRQASVAVIGLGGVGSWAAESLARSGIGSLHLIDFDEVCVSNVNRQLHALTSTIGQPKVDIIAGRCTDINPEIKIVKRIQFFTPKTSDAVFALRPDVIVDAIDDRHNKVHLIAECRKRRVALVTCGGAGGRFDPTLVQVADIARSYDDPLLSVVRKELRVHHAFPRERRKKWGIPCVFSTEPHTYPQSDGSVACQRETGSDLTLNCESGFGTSTSVTGVFGLFMAAEALKLCPDRITEKEAFEVIEDAR